LPNRVFAWFQDTTNDRDDCRVAEASDISPSNCRETQIRLELCTSQDMAQRWAGTYLGVMDEESRVLKCTLHPGIAKNIAPYERLDITSDVGLSASTWRVISTTPRPGGFLEIEARQYSSTALNEDESDATPSAKFSNRADVERLGKWGDLTNGNTVDIDADGHLTLAGDATVWEDLRYPASSIGLRGNTDPDWVQLADDGSRSTGVYVLGFDDTTEEEVYCAVQLPHEWKEGSNIYAHVHWTPPSGTASLTKGVRWGLEYTWANIGVVDGSGTPATFGNTSIIYVTDSDTFTADEHRMINFAAIDATGKTFSSMLICRLFRDAASSSDDYADDALLLEFDIHYEIDSLGSNTRSSKT
jgi:hypothetical protein